MDAMGVKDLLPIIFERSNAATTIWNIELALILGIIAALVTAGGLAHHSRIKILITLMFYLASWLNLRALIEVSLQRRVLRDIFETMKDKNTDVVQQLMNDSYLIPLIKFKITPLKVTPPEWILGALLIAALGVTAFIWLYPWLASRGETTTAARRAWWDV